RPRKLVRGDLRSRGKRIRRPAGCFYQVFQRIYVEAWKRGWSRAEKKVVMGDGAEWIWNLAEQHFPGAVQIVDLYHARQHLWELARKLHPNDEVNQKVWMKVHQRRLLDQGK